MSQEIHRGKHIFDAARCNSRFLSFCCGLIDKQHPVAHVMYLKSSMRLLWATLDALKALNCSEAELLELLSQLGDGSAAAALATEWGE